MASPKPVSWPQRVRLWTESFFLTRLIPRDRIPPVLRALFRSPMFFNRIGLGFLYPSNIIVLTTTGRRTGRPHTTPVETGPGPRPGSLLVMAGWGGHTDWYRNALKDPCVHVWQRGKEWDATAEPVPETEVAEMLKTLSDVSPGYNGVWSRWAGFEIDGSDGSYLRAAPHFPSLYLVPVDLAAQEAHMEEKRRAALEQLDCTRRDTRALFRRLDPELVVHDDERAWRVRDVLGHVAAWNAEAARSVEAYADGGQYIAVSSEAEYDDYNGPAADERRKWAIEEVWTEYEVAHDELRKAVETLPVEKWGGEMVYPWNQRGTVEDLVKIMMRHEAVSHGERVAEAATLADQGH